MRVFIDNNVWDYFFEHNIDLNEYFPKIKFSLYITKQGLYEIKQMPDKCRELKTYIENYLVSLVKVDSIFGFYNPSLPKNEQRISGFSFGRFASKNESAESARLAAVFAKKIKRKDSQILFQEEADIALATRSLHSVVLTFDAKKGPLLDSYNNGGKVIFLKRQESQSLPSHIFMLNIVEQIINIET